MLKAKAISYLEEYQTNSCPIKLVCFNDDGVISNYFVKFAQSGQHHDLLVYELVASELARRVSITVPDAALINVPQEIISTAKLRRNKHITPEQTGLGSQEIPCVTMQSLMFPKVSMKDFKKLRQPLDLVTIALLDLHLDNRDRRQQNFNLLLTHGAKRDLVAIDHLACFGGESRVGQAFSPYINRNLSILLSDFARQLLSFAQKEAVHQKVKDYFCILTDDCIQDVIQRVQQVIPPDWECSEDLFNRILDLLTNSERNRAVREEFNLLLLTGVLKR